MKNIKPLIFMSFIISIFSCAAPQDRYNTQTGALLGAGIGAVAGQAIGRDTHATLIGAEIGTLLGSILGNAADQNAAAVKEAGSRQAVYYDNNRGNLESVPLRQKNPCRKVTRRIWENGRMVKETVEEICETD